MGLHQLSRPFRFAPGMVHITSGADQLLSDAGLEPIELVLRHVRGDWGDLDDFDKESNERALATRNQIRSVYQLTHGKCYVVTEVGHTYTTIYLPSEH